MVYRGLLIFLLTLPLSAQTAKVIQLSDDDAKQAKHYADAVSTAQIAQEKFEAGIRLKYLWEDIVYPSMACASINNGPMTCPPGFGKPDTAEEKKKHTSHVQKQGWDNGFEYSEDYKFIVPKPYPTTTPCNVLSSDCVHYTGTVIPATGGWVWDNALEYNSNTR